MKLGTVHFCRSGFMRTSVRAMRIIKSTPIWRGSAAATCCLNDELSNTASTLCGAPPDLATACWPPCASS